MLALAFGRRLERFLDSKFVEYAVIGFIVIALIGSVISVIKWVKGSGGAKAMKPQPAK
jgi:hypothetical protein